jgi:Domain of unknown function (DUF5666)
MTKSVQPDNENQAEQEAPSLPDRSAGKVKPAKQDKTTMALLLVAAFVAIGGVGFAVGHVTAPSAAAAANPSGRGGFGGRNFASLAPGQTFNTSQFGGRGGVGGLGGGVTGTVQSVDGSTMKVQLANGTTVTIDLTGSTTYHGETSAASGDVKVGSSVTVQVDTSALASETPAPGSSGGRTLSAKDVLITNP